MEANRTSVDPESNVRRKNSNLLKCQRHGNVLLLNENKKQWMCKDCIIENLQGELKLVSQESIVEEQKELIERLKFET